jgi:hypothetical protein
MYIHSFIGSYVHSFILLFIYLFEFVRAIVVVDFQLTIIFKLESKQSRYNINKLSTVESIIFKT